MQINFVLPAMGNSGGIDVVYKYATLLREEGHTVTIYKEIIGRNMHRYKSRIKNWVHCIYCTVKSMITLKKNKREYDKYVLSINNLFMKDADAVIATSWPSAYRVNKLNKDKGKKFYFIQDFEIWDNEEYVKETYKLPLNKIVISSWINQRMREELDIGPFPIVFNGLDTDMYHNTGKRKEDTSEINFLMLNHILPKKGVKNGLEVFQKVKKKYKNCKLRMFGMCDNSNLPDDVEYYQNPTKQKLLDLYSNSDIFIFPSLEEGWGLTPLEAMACGCVVVGTNTGFVLDLGQHENNMMISTPNNVDEMVENVEQLIMDTELMKKIQKNSIETIRQLEWKQSVQKLISSIERL